MPGTIFRLPDDSNLQRGITFTILPDGRSLRVPAMSRFTVRAESQKHEQDGDKNMMQALQDILHGKKPVKKRARFRRDGSVGVQSGNRPGVRAGPAPVDPNAGFRPVMEGGERVAGM